MKSEKSLALYAAVLFLFGISAIFSLTSCSKHSGTAEHQPTPSPTKPKMEGQSGNWKITVESIHKIPKTTDDPVRDSQGGNEFKYDTLDVTLDVTYIGSSGEIESPVVFLVNDKGGKFETVTIVISSTSPTADMTAAPNFDDPEMKARFEVLYWFLHRSKEKTRALKNGEKFTLTYTFSDPKDYTNLNLAFGDVPPFPLEVPQDEKGTKQ